MRGSATEFQSRVDVLDLCMIVVGRCARYKVSKTHKTLFQKLNFLFTLIPVYTGFQERILTSTCIQAEN